MRIFRSDDGAELREEDVRSLATAYAGNAPRESMSKQQAASSRILDALKPRRCTAVMVTSGGTPLASCGIDRYRCNLLAGHEFAHQTAPETWDR